MPETAQASWSMCCVVWLGSPWLEWLSRAPLINQMSLSWFFSGIGLILSCYGLVSSKRQVEEGVESWQATTPGVQRYLLGVPEKSHPDSASVFNIPEKDASLGKMFIPEQGPKQLWLVRLGHMPGLAKGEERPWEEWSSHCLKKGRRMLVIKTSDTTDLSWQWDYF